MKKTIISRLLSLVLVLVMVCTMLPMTAFAATGHKISIKVYKAIQDSSLNLGYTYEQVGTIITTCTDDTSHSGYNHYVPLKDLHPSEVGLSTDGWKGWVFDLYYSGQNGNKIFYNWTDDTVNATANVTGSEPYPCSKNMYLVYEASKPNVTYTLNYDLQGGQEASAFPSQSATNNTGSATFTIHSGTPTRDGYDFKGWSTTAGGSVTHNPGGSITITTNTTLYAVWEEKTPVDPTPDKPSDDTVITQMGEAAVTVDCTNEDVSHAAATYPLTVGTFNVGDVTGDAETGYKVDVSVTSATYVTAYNGTTNATHTPATDTKSFTMTYNAETEAWSGSGVTFDVVCETPTPQPPTAPTDEDLKELLDGKVTVDCVNTEVSHADKTYGLLGTYTTATSEDGNTITITLNNQAYCDEYNTDVAAGHTLVATQGTVTLTVTHDGTEWVAGNETVTIQVQCEDEEEENNYKKVHAKVIPVTKDEDGTGYIQIGVGLDKDFACQVSNSCTSDGHLILESDIHPDLNDMGLYEDYKDYVFKAWDRDCNGFGLNKNKEPAWTNLAKDKTITTHAHENEIFYLVYVKGEETPEPPTTPTEPEVPGEDELKELLDGKVTVDCVNTEVSHDGKTYGLLGDYTTATSNDGKTITVTLNNQAYCDAYNDEDDITVAHTLVADQANKTLTLTYVDNEWVAGEGVTIEVKCETPEIVPDKPTKAEIKDLITGVSIDCINESKKHVEKNYGLINGTYKIGDVEKVGDVYISYVEIKAKEYIEEYNEYKSGHKLAPSNGDTVRIPLMYVEGEDGGWALASGSSSKVTAYFEVICKNKPVSDGELDDVPKTGDRIMETLGVSAAAIAGLAVLAVILSKKKRAC